MNPKFIEAKKKIYKYALDQCLTLFQCKNQSQKSKIDGILHILHFGRQASEEGYSPAPPTGVSKYQDSQPLPQCSAYLIDQLFWQGKLPPTEL